MMEKERPTIKVNLEEKTLSFEENKINLNKAFIYAEIGKTTLKYQEKNWGEKIDEIVRLGLIYNYEKSNDQNTFNHPFFRELTKISKFLTINNIHNGSSELIYETKKIKLDPQMSLESELQVIRLIGYMHVQVNI